MVIGRCEGRRWLREGGQWSVATRGKRRRMRATRKLDELRQAQKETTGLRIFQRMAVGRRLGRASCD
jgi:hypothetical protein